MASVADSEMLSFDEFLNYWAEEKPDQIALEMGERVTTYGAMDPLTRRLITHLADNGVGQGDRFAWLGKNSDRFFTLLYAAARVGAVIVPIGWRLARVRWPISWATRRPN